VEFQDLGFFEQFLKPGNFPEWLQGVKCPAMALNIGSKRGKAVVPTVET